MSRTEGFRLRGRARRAALAWAGAALSGIGMAGAQTSFKYDFGPAGSAVAPGFVRAAPATLYSPSSGFGFEKSGVVCHDRGGEALTGDFCTMNGEFMFSVRVPQGNYTLTVRLGDPAGVSETTVEAENQRLLFDRVTTASGQKVTRTLTVNRREARSADGSVTMSLKDRELGYYTWDDKLTLRFSGRKPAVAAVELTRTEDAVTWFLCGNSTVVDQMDQGWAAWGQYIPHFFKPGVAVANYAESGLTAGAFLSMKRLSKLLADSRPGDYVAVEFGHNDQKNPGDVNAYPGNLKTFADQIKARRCIPVFVTPTAREGDNDPRTSIGGLAEVMRNQARSLGVALIDLNQMSIRMLQAYGPADAGRLYKDGTHFTEIGGYELARCVARGVKELDNTLTPFLSTERPDFDPARPDPVDYLTREREPEPVSIQSLLGLRSRPGRPASLELLRDGLFESRQGSFHTADGKEIRIQAVPAP